MTRRCLREMWRPSVLWALSLLAALAGCSVTQTHPAAQPQPELIAEQAEAREQALRQVALSDPDLALFGTDPTKQLGSQESRVALSIQQHSFAEVGRDFDPDVNSDGTVLVFASTRHSSKPNLYLQSVKGRAVTQLTDDPASEIQPRLSPDGKRVAFASDRSGQWDIYVLDLDKRMTTQLTHNQTHELCPSWSPDGKWLAYSRLAPASGVWELWLASIEDRTERSIGPGLLPCWSPDGSHIAFQRPRQRDGMLFSVWKVQLNNGEPSWPTEVAAEPDAALISPAWSPDGKQLAFCRVPARSLSKGVNGATARPAESDIWLIETDGSGRIRLTDGGTNFGPRWSADGRIFFSSDRDGRERVWGLRVLGLGQEGLADSTVGGD